MNNFCEFSEKEIALISSRLIHLAIVMDGNGRWATQKNLKRVEGHKVGAKTLKNVVQECFRIGIKYVTVFGFSTENWSRPKEEVSSIFNIINNEFKNIIEDYQNNEVKVKIIGKKNELPGYLIKAIDFLEKKTSKNNINFLTICLNYSGREDILDAINKVIYEKNSEIFDKKIDTLSPFLATKDVPDPDFLIRTGGEFRISNFLLYQIAYTELYFSNIMWPDFSKKNLYEAIKVFLQRKRKFGSLNSI